MNELLDIGDMAMNCRVEGTGRPVLLVHAYPVDHSIWRRQIESLANDYRVIAPDLIGFGASGVPRDDSPRLMTQYADELAVLLDRLGVVEPVCYVGVSMAGYIGWEFARRHPQRLDRMLLACTKAAADTSEFAAKREAAALKVVAEGAEAIKGTPRSLLGLTTRNRRPELERELRRIVLATDPRGIAAAQRGMARRADAREWLGELTLPIQLVAGEEDTFSPPSEMMEWAGLLPNARLEVIPDAGHLPMLEQPAAFTALLRDFLESPSASA